MSDRKSWCCASADDDILGLFGGLESQENHQVCRRETPGRPQIAATACVTATPRWQLGVHNPALNDTVPQVEVHAPLFTSAAPCGLGRKAWMAAYDKSADNGDDRSTPSAEDASQRLAARRRWQTGRSFAACK